MNEPRIGPADVEAFKPAVERIVRNHPETSTAVWIVVLVFGFLLVIPIGMAAIFTAVALEIHVLLGIVVGMAAWLGVFWLIRGAMFKRRKAKVRGFVGEFNQTFPDGQGRAAALHCLELMQDEDNQVLTDARTQLVGKPTAGGAAQMLEPPADDESARGV